MLNYADEYGEYRDTFQVAVTLIMSSDAALEVLPGAANSELRNW